MGLSYTLPPPVPRPSPVSVTDGERDLYGYDIAFKGNLLLTPGGDYMRLGGEDNLRAAVYRRLITRPGEYRFRPTYGCGVQDFVKKAPTSAVLDALRQRIVDQVAQDSRVSQVDVVVEAITIQSVPVLQIAVKVVAAGALLRFTPFTFAREAS